MKKIIVLLLTIILFIPNVFATNARTLGELKSELAALKTKKANQEYKKKRTNNEIESARNNIYTSQNEITQNREKIANAKKEVEELNNEIASTKESIKRLINSYELLQGDNIYLEYIFQAESYADLVYRYEVVNQILGYNNSQIESWESKVTYNEQLQVDLAKQEEELNKKIASLESSIDSLGSDLEKISDITMDIQEQIDGINSLIKYYEGLGCKDNQDLNECVSVKGDTMFRKPLIKGTITSYFGYRIDPIRGSYRFHSGTDIGGNAEGTNVYATANGVVGMIIDNTSKKICGGRQVYIYHTINGKKYTSGYMHLLDINVKVGDKVTSETVIGHVGGGRKTQSWESCSTGAHLHFMLGYGWYGSTYSSYSTWISNLFDAKKTLNLPNKYTYWYSR
mgnify:FL=1